MAKLANYNDEATTLKHLPYLVSLPNQYQNCLIDWCEINLSDDFLCWMTYGSRIDKSRFYFRNASDATLFKLTWLGISDPVYFRLSD